MIEADISKEETLQILLTFLKNDFPESLYMWYLFWYIQRGFLSLDHISPQVFLNDLKNIKSILVVYSLNGLPGNESKIVTEKFVLFHCDNQSIDIAESMIHEYFLGNRSPQLTITAFGIRCLPLIEKFRRNIGEEKCSEIEHCFVMEIDRSTLEESKEKVQTIPDGINIHRLSVIDANDIDQSWSYKSKDSLGQIKYQIEHFPTLGKNFDSSFVEVNEIFDKGAYRDGKLVSWRLLQYSGSLGMARTIAKERRQGLSSLLNVKLAEQVFQMQDHVFCSILQTNISSFQLLTKLGYRNVCDEYWLYIFNMN